MNYQATKTKTPTKNLSTAKNKTRSISKGEESKCFMTKSKEDQRSKSLTPTGGKFLWKSNTQDPGSKRRSKSLLNGIF